MNPLNILCLFYLALVIWFTCHYLYSEHKDKKLKQLKEYDRQYQVESERKARDER